MTEETMMMGGFESAPGRQLRVLAKNENYIAQQLVDGTPGKLLACTPDLISIIDSDSGENWFIMNYWD